MQAYITLSHKQEELINENSTLNKERARLENDLNRLRRELESTIKEKDDLEKNNIEKYFFNKGCCSYN